MKGTFVLLSSLLSIVASHNIEDILGQVADDVDNIMQDINNVNTKKTTFPAGPQGPGERSGIPGGPGPLQFPPGEFEGQAIPGGPVGPLPFPPGLEGPVPFAPIPIPFEAGKPLIEDMAFGTDRDVLRFNCSVLGCRWNETVVHDDWMIYGAGIGNPAAMNPMICAQRCALDVNCGAFEYDMESNKKTNYCSWWSVGACDEGQGMYHFNTCAKVRDEDNGGEFGESGFDFVGIPGTA